MVVASPMTSTLDDARGELLPCPFCGGEEVILYKGRDLGEWISCRSCGLEAPSETGQTKEQAIEYWNRRAAPVPQCDAESAEGLTDCAEHMLLQARPAEGGDWINHAYPVITHDS